MAPRIALGGLDDGVARPKLKVVDCPPAPTVTSTIVGGSSASIDEQDAEESERRVEDKR